MKVVHIVNTDIRGGAAQASFWPFKSFTSHIGIESKMLVQRKFSNDKNVILFLILRKSDK